MYSIREMQVLVYHFVKYSLITTKYSDFLLFKQAFEIIKTKGYLTEKGLLEIVRIKSILNGINISSGNITKRHIIIPIQIQLINFVYEKNGLDNNIVYEVYKDNLLSQTISENIQFRLIYSNNKYIQIKTLE